MGAASSWAGWRCLAPQGADSNLSTPEKKPSLLEMEGGLPL